MSESRSDQGFTLVELLIVIVVLGILAAVTVFAVRGITVEAEETVCDAEKRVIETSVYAYFARNDVELIGPPTVDPGPSDPDRYELTLVETGYIREPAARWSLASDGTLTPVGNPC